MAAARPQDTGGPPERHLDPLDRVFHALASATRRAMLEALAEGPRTVGELAAPFAMSLEGAAKHVRVLEQAGLVRREIVGRRHRCRIERGPLAGAADWLRISDRAAAPDPLARILEGDA